MSNDGSRDEDEENVDRNNPPGNLMQAR